MVDVGSCEHFMSWKDFMNLKSVFKLLWLCRNNCFDNVKIIKKESKLQINAINNYHFDIKERIKIKKLTVKFYFFLKSFP